MSTREQARLTALTRLADRVSIADTLTEEQQAMIDRDEMFELGAKYATYNTLVDKPVTCLGDLEGRVLSRVERFGDEEIRFYLTDTHYVQMHHIQDCCEDVIITDICGNLDDLVGTPLLMVEETVSNSSDKEDESDSYSYDSSTWTFYRFRTIKGSVDIRWHGSSNGYYSESVDISIVNGEE